MAAKSTRGWLLEQPRAERLRLTLANGETRILEVGPSPVWWRIAETIDAMQPTTIEAQNASGGLLRARDPARDGVPAETADAGDDLEVTEPAENESQLELFARLLADAHRSSQSFMETAFNRMVDLANVSTRRMESMERSMSQMEKMLRRAYAQVIDANEDDTPPDPLTQLIGAFTGGQSQGQMAQAIQALQAAQAAEQAAAAKHPAASSPTNGKGSAP